MIRATVVVNVKHEECDIYIGRVTEHLTRGALISRLERHGVRVRGTPLALDDKRMAAMLRDRGEDVSAEPKPTGGDDVAR